MPVCCTFLVKSDSTRGLLLSEDWLTNEDLCALKTPSLSGLCFFGNCRGADGGRSSSDLAAAIWIELVRCL